MRERRKFTREFKREAVRLSRQPGRGIGEVAKSLDVGECLRRRWQDEFAADVGSAFAGTGKQTGLEAENRKLRAEVDRLRMEREILKKSDGLLREGAAMKYSFFEDHRATWSITFECEVLAVSRSEYDAWRRIR